MILPLVSYISQHCSSSWVVSIPSSNADSERGFSILTKIHTDQTSNLEQSTIVSIMTMKFNSDDCYFDVNLPEDILVKCKKATYMSLHHES